MCRTPQLLGQHRDRATGDWRCGVRETVDLRQASKPLKPDHSTGEPVRSLSRPNLVAMPPDQTWCQRVIVMALVAAVVAGCGSAAEDPDGRCRAERIPKPTHSPLPGVLTGLGGTLRDWAATHDVGYRAPCEAEARSGIEVYYFEPMVPAEVEGAPPSHRYRIEVRNDRVVSVQINFANRLNALTRDQQVFRTTPSKARRAALAEFPDGAHFDRSADWVLDRLRGLRSPCDLRLVASDGLSGVSGLAAFWSIPDRTGGIRSVVLTLYEGRPLDDVPVCRGSARSRR